MIVETKKVLAVAALIATTGVAGVEMTRASAVGSSPAGQAQDYAQSRIVVAFSAAAEVPEIPYEEFSVETTDPRPVGCSGPFRAEVEAECLDVAHEVSSDWGGGIRGEIESRAADLVTLDAFDLAEF